jgi:hypothetical protein
MNGRPGGVMKIESGVSARKSGQDDGLWCERAKLRWHDIHIYRLGGRRYFGVPSHFYMGYQMSHQTHNTMGMGRF